MLDPASKATIRPHAEQSDLAAPHVRQEVQRVVERELHLSADQIRHARPAALVWNRLQLHPGEYVEVFERKVLNAAGIRDRGIELPMLGASVLSGNRIVVVRLRDHVIGVHLGDLVLGVTK
jgi:hypothetical protein